MTAGSHADVEADHRQWRSEIAACRDDLAIWQGEYLKARADLARAEAALRDQEEASRSHAQALDEYEERLSGGERTLAQDHQDGVGGSLDGHAGDHVREGDRHGEQRSAHERIKRRHHALMAYWSLLVKALAKPS